MRLACLREFCSEAFMSPLDDSEAAYEPSLGLREEDLATTELAHLPWRRSSYCDAGSCVEVVVTEHAVYVRDSAGGLGPVLTFTPASWQAFLRGVAAGLLS
jgi:Domain of unknown function (DUF397)